MEPKQMMKQVVDFNRVAFDNGFNAMVMLQDQAEGMMNKLLERSPWLPKEGEKFFKDWMNMCRKGREDYKRMVEDSFRRTESFFASAETSEMQ